MDKRYKIHSKSTFKKKLVQDIFSMVYHTKRWTRNIKRDAGNVKKDKARFVMCGDCAKKKKKTQ